MPEFCSVEREGHLTVVTLRRPEVLNALNSPAHFELEQVWNDFFADDEQWAAIITGDGDRAFCTGNDLRHTVASGGKPQMPPTGFAGLTSRADVVKPLIAAVNGVCVAGGFETALACDIIIAAEHARFGLTEPRVGRAALAGGLYRLPLAIGHQRTMALVLTGEMIDAAEAHRLGFVNKVVPKGGTLAAAREIAESILACSPASIRATKEVVLRGYGMPDARAAVLADYPHYQKLRESNDFIEGPKAFAEKRKPQWSGN